MAARHDADADHQRCLPTEVHLWRDSQGRGKDEGREVVGDLNCRSMVNVKQYSAEDQGNRAM